MFYTQAGYPTLQCITSACVTLAPLAFVNGYIIRTFAVTFVIATVVGLFTGMFAQL